MECGGLRVEVNFYSAKKDVPLLNINDKNKKKGGTSMKLKISLRTYGINQGMIFYFKTTPGQNTIKTMLQKYCSFLIEQSKLKTIKENLLCAFIYNAMA